MTFKSALCTILIFYTCAASSSALGLNSTEPSPGEAVYVPIYSHIYGGPRSRPILLTATLSIRNTDVSGSIEVAGVDYYDSTGKMIKRYVTKPFVLPPMAGKRFIVEEQDTTGGSSASFIVKWRAAEKVNPPVIQAVHISTVSGQGISFITFGKAIPHSQ